MLLLSEFLPCLCPFVGISVLDSWIGSHSSSLSIDESSVISTVHTVSLLFLLKYIAHGDDCLIIIFIIVWKRIIHVIIVFSGGGYMYLKDKHYTYLLIYFPVPPLPIIRLAYMGVAAIVAVECSLLVFPCHLSSIASTTPLPLHPPYWI